MCIRDSFRTLKPDVLLMDIRMDKMTGLEASERILSQFPDARILFLTTFSDDEYVVQALRLGAKGYILKQDFESIIPAPVSYTHLCRIQSIHCLQGWGY